MSSEQRDDETQTEFTMRLLKEEWIDQEHKRLLAEIALFDSSDAYHMTPRGGMDGGDYYAALERVEQLIRGEIKTWTDPDPRKVS